LPPPVAGAPTWCPKAAARGLGEAARGVTAITAAGPTVWNCAPRNWGDMTMKRLTLILMSGCSLAACTTTQLDEPRTAGEINTGYNYIPVDPLEVSVLIDEEFAPGGVFPPGTSAKRMRETRYIRCVARGDNNPADVMDALPDHTVRMAVREVTGEAKGGFGPVAVSGKGRSYQVIVDSIFADTTNVRFGIRIGSSHAGAGLMSLPENLAENTEIDVVRLDRNAPLPAGYQDVTLPIYVGIGLRLTASLTTRKAGINLSNLPAIAASVEAEKSSGSLTMQTLGVYNQQVASTFPIPSELNTTAIQNALVSLGAVKAIVYDRDTGTRPRVTGIYNPLPTSDPQLINKIYSALAKSPINWSPCGSS
jgi:hypothetical protein